MTMLMEIVGGNIAVKNWADLPESTKRRLRDLGYEDSPDGRTANSPDERKNKTTTTPSPVTMRSTTGESYTVNPARRGDVTLPATNINYRDNQIDSINIRPGMTSGELLEAFRASGSDDLAFLQKAAAKVEEMDKAVAQQNALESRKQEVIKHRLAGDAPYKPLYAQPAYSAASQKAQTARDLLSPSPTAILGPEKGALAVGGVGIKSAVVYSDTKPEPPKQIELRSSPLDHWTKAGLHTDKMVADDQSLGQRAKSLGLATLEVTRAQQDWVSKNVMTKLVDERFLNKTFPYTQAAKDNPVYMGTQAVMRGLTRYAVERPYEAYAWVAPGYGFKGVSGAVGSTALRLTEGYEAGKTYTAATKIAGSAVTFKGSTAIAAGKSLKVAETLATGSMVGLWGLDIYGRAKGQSTERKLEIAGETAGQVYAMGLGAKAYDYMGPELKSFRVATGGTEMFPEVKTISTTFGIRVGEKGIPIVSYVPEKGGYSSFSFGSKLGTTGWEASTTKLMPFEGPTMTKIYKENVLPTQDKISQDRYKMFQRQAGFYDSRESKFTTDVYRDGKYTTPREDIALENVYLGRGKIIQPDYRLTGSQAGMTQTAESLRRPFGDKDIQLPGYTKSQAIKYNTRKFEELKDTPEWSQKIEKGEVRINPETKLGIEMKQGVTWKPILELEPQQWNWFAPREFVYQHRINLDPVTTSRTEFTDNYSSFKTTETKLTPLRELNMLKFSTIMTPSPVSGKVEIQVGDRYKTTENPFSTMQPKKQFVSELDKGRAKDLPDYFRYSESLSLSGNTAMEAGKTSKPEGYGRSIYDGPSKSLKQDMETANLRNLYESYPAKAFANAPGVSTRVSSRTISGQRNILQRLEGSKSSSSVSSIGNPLGTYTRSSISSSSSFPSISSLSSSSFSVNSRSSSSSTRSSDSSSSSSVFSDSSSSSESSDSSSSSSSGSSSSSSSGSSSGSGGGGGGLPPGIFGGPDLSGGKRGKKKGGASSKQFYVPSVEAVVFNLRGKRSKAAEITGIDTRRI